MENYLKDLEKLLETTTSIFIIANESYLFAKYFDKSNDDVEQAIIKSPSIRFIQHSLWKNCIIEIDKLFGLATKNNHHSFLTLFSYISKYKAYLFSEDSDFRILHSKWSTIQTDKKKLINQINNLRKKLYAHTDIGKEEFLLEIHINYNDINNLLLDAKLLISEINKILFDKEFIYNPIYFKNPQIVQIMADKKKISRDEKIKKILGT